jgi:hypothetical protein
MIGTIECKTNDVDATVDDSIAIRRDGSVLLQRRTTFQTDSDDARPFRFFKKEFLGGSVDDNGTIESDPPGILNLFTGHAPGYLVVDLEASVRSSSPVVIVVRSQLLSASCNSPLEYEVSFDSPQAAHYSFVLSPHLAAITAPERFQIQVSPAALQPRIQRTEATGEVHLAGSVRISGATPPFGIKCLHEEGLPSTKLLEYYREKFSR